MKYAALIRLSKKEQNLLAEKEFLFFICSVFTPLRNKAKTSEEGGGAKFGETILKNKNIFYISLSNKKNKRLMIK